MKLFFKPFNCAKNLRKTRTGENIPNSILGQASNTADNS